MCFLCFVLHLLQFPIEAGPAISWRCCPKFAVKRMRQRLIVFTVEIMAIWLGNEHHRRSLLGMLRSLGEKRNSYMIRRRRVLDITSLGRTWTCQVHHVLNCRCAWLWNISALRDRAKRKKILPFGLELGGLGFGCPRFRARGGHSDLPWSAIQVHARISAYFPEKMFFEEFSLALINIQVLIGHQVCFEFASGNI